MLLPIEGESCHLSVKLLPHQEAFFSSPARARFLTGGRQTGKSYALLYDLCSRAENVPGPGELVCISPSWTMSDHLRERNLPEWLEAWGLADRVRRLGTQRLLRFSCGAVIRFHAPRPGSLNGVFPFVAVDEAQWVPLDFYRRFCGSETRVTATLMPMPHFSAEIDEEFPGASVFRP